jgi:hypothetical protein
MVLVKMMGKHLTQMKKHQDADSVGQVVLIPQILFFHLASAQDQ